MAADRSEEHERDGAGRQGDEEAGEDIRECVDVAEVADLTAREGLEHFAAEVVHQRAERGGTVDVAAGNGPRTGGGCVGFDALESGEGGHAPVGELGGEAAGGGLQGLADDSHRDVTVGEAEPHMVAEALVQPGQDVVSEREFMA